mgnify:CR=1 FL=1
MKADIRNPLRYLLITYIMSEFISLMIQASPYPLLIAPRNHAGDLPDSVKVSRHHINKIIEFHHVYLQIYEGFFS